MSLEIPKTDKEYFAHKFISASDLKGIFRSIKHWKNNKANPKKTEPLYFGSAFHSYILEPDKFEKYAVTFDGASFNSKKAIEFLEYCDNENKMPVLEKWQTQLKDMKQAIIENAECRDILNIDMDFNYQSKNIEIEKPVIWSYRRPEWTKAIGCKSKWDFGCKDRNYIVDLKTLQDASTEDECKRAIEKFHYDLQGVFYRYSYKYLYKVLPIFIFIFIEKEEPYGIRNYYLSDNYITTGQSKINTAFNRLKVYWNSFDDPKYYDGYPFNQQQLQAIMPSNYYSSKFL